MRDLSIFKVPPKPSATAVASQRWRAQCAELAQELQLPPIIARHAVNKGASKTRVREIASTFFAGCCLTGQPFTDKFTARAPDPRAAVVRKDGSMVSYAVWMLSQEGSIPDQLLVNASAAITAHAQRAQQPQPRVPAQTRAPTPQPQEQQDAISSLIDMGSEHADDGEPYNPNGGVRAEPTGASALIWDDDSQTMVRVAI